MIAPSGTSLVTTEPAPTSASFPTVTPGKITQPAPREAPDFTLILRRTQSPLTLGYLSLVNVTLGPTKTLSSIVTPVGIKTKGLILQLSPITTPSSMYTKASILQFLPILHLYKFTWS